MQEEQLELNTYQLIDWLAKQGAGLPSHWKDERKAMLREEQWEPRLEFYAFPYRPDLVVWADYDAKQLRLLDSGVAMIGSNGKKFLWAFLFDEPDACFRFRVIEGGFSWSPRAWFVGVQRLNTGLDEAEKWLVTVRRAEAAHSHHFLWRKIRGALLSRHK